MEQVLSYEIHGYKRSFFVVKNQVIIFREIQQELARSIQFQSLKSIGECITVNKAGERGCQATF